MHGRTACAVFEVESLSSVPRDVYRSASKTKIYEPPRMANRSNHSALRLLCLLRARRSLSNLGLWIPSHESRYRIQGIVGIRRQARHRRKTLIE